MRRRHIGCIDGRVLEVRMEVDQWVIDLDGSEARLSLEAAGRLAQMLTLVDRTPKPEPIQPIELPPTEGETSPGTGRGQRHRHYPVTINDLVEASLLAPLSILTFRREGRVYEALVTDEGMLLVGDREFDTPSGAAKHAAGTTSEPGWDVWSIGGKTLADLRWRLLALRFPEPRAGWSEDYIKEKRRAAVRWVEYALGKGLDPGRRDETALADHFGSRGFTESTSSVYRHHLRQWFQEYGPLN